ncbi:MAG: choice-of-anchor L domain-containing protein [Chitinophagaceae bacterium]
MAFAFTVVTTYATAQLVITNEPDARALAQKLVGKGVHISNITFTGNLLMTGYFRNTGETEIGIDSGILLTTGKAKTKLPYDNGADWNGGAEAYTIDADNSWMLAGDADLATITGATPAQMHDACVLEFDFVPMGDSISFNYVFSSEEYHPSYVCEFNDAFAFLVSGPGITGIKNIALVPGTTTPVSIYTLNDVPRGACPNNQEYYIDNRFNTFFSHDGHTAILSAQQKVQRCKTYHLKLVIADVGDDRFDSGVFLQAKSLTSDIITISSAIQTDPVSGTPYLVEGCTPGSFNVHRSRPDANPLRVDLIYDGPAVSSVDLFSLPASVIIPANEDFVPVPVTPLVDGVTEGTELLKIYTLAGCGSGVATDSSIIEIRDFDNLSITPDSIVICTGAAAQLEATTGYAVYKWSNSATLSNVSIPNPVATPVKPVTTYTCTAGTGTCFARDSVLVKWRMPVVRIDAGGDTIIAINQRLQLNAVDLNNAGITTYKWSPSNYLTDPTIANPVTTLTHEYHYMVTGTTADGCEGKDEVHIKVYKGPEIYVPTGFTPDNNGLNDILRPVSVGIREFRYFRVFNRWGELVFSTKDIRRGWDGQVDGIAQVTGTYIWMAEGIDYNGNTVARKGVVTIIH